MDRLYEGDDISVMVTLPYVLGISLRQKSIAQYYFSHSFDGYFIRSLQFYADNNTDVNSIKLVDFNTLAVMSNPNDLK